MKKMKRCKYLDAGWCYAPEGVDNTSNKGACPGTSHCPQGKRIVWPDLEFPPVNLYNAPRQMRLFDDDDKDF